MKKRLILFFLTCSILSSCKSGSLTNYPTNFLEAFKENKNDIIIDNGFINKKVNLNYSPFVPKNYKKNVILAVKNQPTIISGFENINALISGEKVAESALKPQVSFQASSGASRVDSENSFAALGSFSMSKIMYDYGSLEKNVKSQKLRTLASKQQLDSQAESLALSSYLTLFELANNQIIQKFYDDGLKLGEPLIEQIKSISTSGIADKTMILKARKEFSELNLLSIKAKNATKNSEVQFKSIFQTNLIPKLNLIKPIKVENFDKIKKKMMNYHPSIKAQNILIQSLKDRLKSLQAQKKPNLSLRAGINTPAKDPLEDTSANVGFLVNYVYSDGGKIDAEIESIKAQIKSSIKQRDEIVRNLNNQLNLSYERYKGAIEAKKELIELVKILQETRDTSRAQLVSGRSKIQDVLNNELELAKKEIELISIDTNIISASYSLKSLSSGLIPKIIN